MPYEDERRRARGRTDPAREGGSSFPRGKVSPPAGPFLAPASRGGALCAALRCAALRTRNAQARHGAEHGGSAASAAADARAGRRRLGAGRRLAAGMCGRSSTPGPWGFGAKVAPRACSAADSYLGCT
eukprot:scaffold952_cov409-Prasinococcus_capsulatus_cf.AAC.27